MRRETYPPRIEEGVESRLPFGALISYSIGEVPVTITMALVGLLALFFYTSVMGLSGTLVGIGIASGLVVDALFDPLVGFRSDVSRHPFGRRHSFMVVGSLAMGPCFFLFFSPPKGLGTAALFAWLVTFSILFRAFSAVYRIPYLSLGAEMTQSYRERTRVTAVRALAGMLGTIAAVGLGFLLFFPPLASGLDSKLNYSSYPKMGAFFGLLMTACGLIATRGTLQFRQAGTATGTVRSPAEFFRGFSFAFKNTSFVRLWLSGTLFFNAVVVNASLAVLFYTWYAGIAESKAISGMQIGFYIGAMAGVWVWLRLARNYEKRTLYIAGMLGTAAILLSASLLVGSGHLLGTGNIPVLLGGNVVAGLFASSLWVMPYSMLADVADQDEVDTGLRRGGIYFGIVNFGEKVAAGLAVLTSGTLLTRFVHLQPGAGIPDAAAISRIGLVYGLVPGVIVIVAAALMPGYSLTEKVVSQLQSQLKLRNRMTGVGVGVAANDSDAI